MTRTGKMADRVIAPVEYCRNEDITYLRIFKVSDREWNMDGCTDAGMVSEACWSYRTFRECLAMLPLFAADNAPHLLGGAAETTWETQVDNFFGGRYDTV